MQLLLILALFFGVGCVAIEQPNMPPIVSSPVAKARDFMSYSTVQPRGGLPEAFRKFSAGTGHVVFLGGSITRMGNNKGGWSVRVSNDLRRRFPRCKFRFENSGISSIGTMGHAHRFTRDVLGNGTPDLLFVEAAVNDLRLGRSDASARRGMEGVVRSARAQGIEVLMLHFADGLHLKEYAKNKQHMVITEHEAVAEHYAVPSLNLALYVQQKISEGIMDWKRDFRANCHVPAFGQKLYAERVSHMLDNLWGESAATMRGQLMPDAPLDAAPWISGKLLPVTKATDLKGAEVVAKWRPKDKAKTRTGFVNIPVLEVSGAGSSFVVDTEGRAVGLWIIAGPDAPRVRARIDGGAWMEMNLYYAPSRSLHLPRPILFADDLVMGAHKLEVEILPRREKERGGETLRVAYILSSE